MKNEVRPPAWIHRVLEHFCDPYLFEGISGDLAELFRENVESKGRRRARLIYLLQSVGFLRMTFRKRTKNVSNMRSIWLNYFLATFRSVKKHKVFFTINLVGLILAIACSWFALIYIRDEFQFDRQHTGADQMYRLYKRYINVGEGVDLLTFETSGMMGPTLYEEYPEVEAYVRVSPWFDKTLISYEERNISTGNMYFADSTFFDFFDFPVIAGDPSTFLTAPSSIVLSRSLASAIFGDENPLGKTVVGLNDLNYTVTGVFEDLPRQSSLQFDAVVSWSTTVPNIGPLNYRWMNNWLAQGIFTFVRLAEGINPRVVETKMPDMMNRHFTERADQYFLKLLPLKKMYLSGDTIRHGRGMRSGSLTFVYTLGFSALLILVIASVNCINISLSRAAQTRNEVGIRKVLGSTRRQLIGRFITETLFSMVVAAVVSVLIIALLLPGINTISGKELPLEAFFQPVSIIAILGFIVGISTVVGLYPAFVLSAPPVSDILKRKSNGLGAAGWFRRALLALQYAISIFLIICTLFITRQTNYLERKPLGFDKEQVLVIDVDNEMGQKTDVLEAELLSHPNILSVSTSRSAIGAGSYSTTVLPEGYPDELNTRIYGVDQEFFETYGIGTLWGRTFLKGSVADSSNLIVNKALVDFLGWEDPIGKRIRFDAEGESYPIIGVINDFHYHSLATSRIEPMILYLNTTTLRNTSVRIGNGDLKMTMDHIRRTWNGLADKTPLDLYFVDDWFNEQYKQERQLLKVSSVYSMISILLCSLGLYGLTALLLQQRTKEISIRKVLGASVSSIISLVSRQFVIIILASFVLVVPLAYVMVSEWLDNFAYKTLMDPMPFVLSGGAIFVISILIVSGLSVRSAHTNPSEILSTE